MPNVTHERWDAVARMVVDAKLSFADIYFAAGYSQKNSRATACRAMKRLLADVPYVAAKVAELRQQADDALIMDVKERKQVLSEIARARFGQFSDENGNLVVKREQLNNAGVQEVSTERTLVGVRTKLKLRDPVPAIDLLNKMERIGQPDQPSGNVSNTLINIIVSSEKARELSEKVAERLLSGNSNG